jgi:hypothetical protein
MKLDLESVRQFHAQQNDCAGVYNGDGADGHRKNAACLKG